jgi:type IV pilus assembly protein PilQ
VKRDQLLGSLVWGSLATVALVRPAIAQDVNVVDVRVSPGGSGGVNVELVTENASDRPQVFLLPPQGNDLVAHVANAKLMVPSQRVVESTPAPGISAVEVTQLDAVTVQVTVRGDGARPTGRIVRGESANVLLSYAGNSTAARDRAQPANTQPFDSRDYQISQNSGDVLVPNPNVTIDGQPANLGPASNSSGNLVPPLMPRAVAPPVGDMAISDLPYAPSSINLGSSEILPRLVLRDAPVREVLSLLARAAGVNVAFAEDSPGDTAAGAAADAAMADGARISVDIENERVEDVFNYVLRISGMQAHKMGNTIFVGQRLPNAARGAMVRSIRLNQADANNAAAFLVSLGAESATPVTTVRVQSLQSQQNNNTQDGVSAPQLTETQRTEQTTIERLRYDPIDSPPILRGLQVTADNRTNSLTLVGDASLINLASAQLSRIDGRLRQVAVNVRIIDIDLDQAERAGFSFSFGVDDTSVVNTGGLGVINWGGWSGNRGPFSTPAGISSDQVGLSPTAVTPVANTFNIANRFLAQLQANVTNGNAKILTDPTLVVQEGQQAEVGLTEEVVGSVEQDIETTDVGTIVTETIEKEEAGLRLGVEITRIDDNGFVTMRVSPSLRVPIGERTSPTGNTFVTLLADRRLASGSIRLRDGQTLVLAGIIQDTDRTTISKVPILGDLPLLGALFRRTERENERRELIVLLTPQVLDDTTNTALGYSYTPSAAAQEMMRQR